MKGLALIRYLLILVLIFAATAPATADSPGTTEKCIEHQDTVKSYTSIIKGTVNESASSPEVVVVKYNLTDYNGQFVVDFPRSVGVEVVSKTGFSGDWMHLEWDEKTEKPTIQYKVNRTRSDRNYSYESNWVFAPVPNHDPSGSDTAVQLTPWSQNAGFIGNEFLLMGKQSQHTQSAGCQRISIIYSEKIRSKVPPADVLELLTYASQRLDVGHRYETVNIFVTPNTSHGPDVPGFARNSEAWVRNVTYNRSYQYKQLFLHEYLHTRQNYISDEIMTNRTRWLNESVANYYAYQILLNHGDISPFLYNQILHIFSNSTNGMLNSPDTWPSRDIPYTKGMVVIAELDQRIRNQTNGSATFATVFRQMNSHHGADTLNQHDVVRYVNETSDNRTGVWLRKQVNTFGKPPVEAAKVKEPTTWHEPWKKICEILRNYWQRFSDILSVDHIRLE